MKPQRIQLSRAAGWRLPDNTIVVSRPSKFGNPYKVGVDGDQQECVRLFFNRCKMRSASGEMEERREAYIAAVKAELRGKNLACWCREGTPCHADILLEIANA